MSALQSGRINYNANPDQQLSHLEMTFPGSGFLAGSRLGELAATDYRLRSGGVGDYGISDGVTIVPGGEVGADAVRRASMTSVSLQAAMPDPRLDQSPAHPPTIQRS
jgi:hypothetical protein